ncbi:hypothetical protein ACIDE9_13010 [Methylophilus sp. 'Pure River']|uniref:hypothetical protein n=1 Tax=Methylophilus sp. 'Pure River' TaxID=3377117 RepID=UPI00398F87C1
MRKVTAIVAVVLGLSVVLPVQAADTNVEAVQRAHQVNFLGKRPYQQVVAKADAEQAWVGATLRVEPNNQQQVLKLHNLGKRAF